MRFCQCILRDCVVTAVRCVGADPDGVYFFQFLIMSVRKIFSELCGQQSAARVYTALHQRISVIIFVLRFDAPVSLYTIPPMNCTVKLILTLLRAMRNLLGFVFIYLLYIINLNEFFKTVSYFLPISSI